MVQAKGSCIKEGKESASTLLSSRILYNVEEAHGACTQVVPFCKPALFVVQLLREVMSNSL